LRSKKKESPTWEYTVNVTEGRKNAYGLEKGREKVLRNNNFEVSKSKRNWNSGPVRARREQGKRYLAFSQIRQRER